MLAFLARLSGTAPFDVALRHRRTASPVLAGYVPFRAPDPVTTFDDLRVAVGEELHRVRRHDAPAADLVLRYPDLRQSGVHTWPVAIDLCSDEHAESTAPLTIRIARDGTVTWLISSAVLAADTASTLLAAFAVFADGLAEHGPRTAPMLSAADRRALDTRNATTTAYPADRCVTRLLAEQAGRTPDATAVSCGGQLLSYRELDRRVTLLARTLAAAGAAPGGRVGVYLSRSTDLPVALLAVLRTGAAYVPLDPIYPRDRVELMLADAGVHVVVTESALAAELPGRVHTVELDTLPPHAGPVEPFDLATPDGPAYVIYTSGSTGRPKGVCVGHRALTNFLCSMARRPGFGATDRMLAVTTVCFDIAGLELYLPLVTGGRVEIAPADTAADGAALRDLVERSAPTVMQATPATWRMLLAAGWSGHQGLRVLCGGEAFPPDLAEALCARTAQVWNLYGPTETTIWSAVSEVRPGAPITLGAPVANTTLHVLDQHGNPVPDRMPGELHIGGHGLAHGYHDRPELTAERFVTTADGTEVYRTGDLVRYDRRGELEYLGRLDHQVKIRGFRIELGEIDACLSGHPDVAQAVTIARDQRLIGYVVPAPGRRIDTTGLREHAARALPDYMVPAALVALTELPLTPNGKVDRNALPEPVRDSPSRAPRTTLERMLCALFADVLGVDDGVGIDDHFVDLGGTSVSAAALVSRVRAEGRHLEARSLFEYPTPAGLAAFLDPGTDATVDTAVDLAAEVRLADDVTPAAEVVRVVQAPRRILLTGATGFVGAFLLRELTRIPDVTVHCLVRGDDHAHAEGRLVAALARYALTVDLDRVRVEVADLAAAELGLAPGRFDELAREVDVVFHAGAVVNWLHSYADLKATNVVGTEQILRLAARHRSVPVHHVSSMGVFAHRAAGSARHRVEDPTGPADGLITGYQRSKWVAEQLIELARERGLPVSVYRVGRVCGDQETGACQSDDLLWRVLKGSIQVGGVPAGTDLSFDLVPADHVAAALVWLSRRADQAASTHHLTNPHLTTFATMVEALRAAGYPLLDLDRDKWCDLVDADPDNAAHTLLSAFRGTAWQPERTEIPLDPATTLRALATSGLACPPVDTTLLTRHQRFFVRTGFLPHPTDPPA